MDFEEAGDGAFREALVEKLLDGMLFACEFSTDDEISALEERQGLPGKRKLNMAFAKLTTEELVNSRYTNGFREYRWD